MRRAWWMEAVGYQVYLKSFYDSNGDGIGDLMGLYEKLDYLYKLGITLIWISPIFSSPMDDNGYDISNHYQIDPVYGTMEDFKKVIAKASKLGIKIILDYVLNHTSDEHPWFIESSKSLDNPYRDYYLWQLPRIINQEKLPPTNWASFFGGSAWAYSEKTDMYYMKIFSNKMPDLNWSHPPVVDEMIKVGKFWLDLGISGFRIDALSHLARAPYQDVLGKGPNEITMDTNKFSNLPPVRDHVKKLKGALFNDDVLTIGEMGGNATIDYCLSYTNFNDQLLSMVFNFDHNWCNNVHDLKKGDDIIIDTKRLKEVLSLWQESYLNKGWLPLNWLNHDQPRLASHYGSKVYPYESQTMLATLMYFQRGTPFIYQGEEIGMTNYDFKDVSEFVDVSSLNYYHALKSEGKLSLEDVIFNVSKTSRDQARLPIAWTSAIYGGFSKVRPWILVNPNKDIINVEKQMHDPNSLWYYYQSIISLRKYQPYKDVIVYGDYEMIPTIDALYLYKRTYQNQSLMIICSFSKDIIFYNMLEYEGVKIILSNHSDNRVHKTKISLAPFGAMVFEIRKKA